MSLFFARQYTACRLGTWYLLFSEAYTCGQRIICIDSCFNEPCQNGGRCINLDDDNFMCECPNEFRGGRCQVGTYARTRVCIIQFHTLTTYMKMHSKEDSNETEMICDVFILNTCCMFLHELSCSWYFVFYAVMNFSCRNVFYFVKADLHWQGWLHWYSEMRWLPLPRAFRW